MSRLANLESRRVRGSPWFPGRAWVEVRTVSRNATNSARVNIQETVRWRAENGRPGRVAWKVTLCEGLALGLLGGGAVVKGVGVGGAEEGVWQVGVEAFEVSGCDLKMRGGFYVRQMYGRLKARSDPYSKGPRTWRCDASGTSERETLVLGLDQPFVGPLEARAGPRDSQDSRRTFSFSEAPTKPLGHSIMIL